MSAEICRTLALACLIVFLDCLILLLLFCTLGVMFMDMDNDKMEELMGKFAAVTIVAGTLSLIFALNFGAFYLILK